MTNLHLLDDLDLAALLCSRVCHDVISPVGAIANGLEVLEEEDDEEMRKIAMDLVTRSARQASAKLQFCRLAFGAAGSAGANIDVGEAGDIAKMFVGEEKIRLDWQAPRETKPKQEVKLLLNMMLMGMSAVPRGGEVTVTSVGDGMQVTAMGQNAKIPEKSKSLLDGALEASELDARLVQVYYATRLAESAGFDLTAQAGEGVVSFTARPRASAGEGGFQAA
jgi:histidine phosphotransferase ChpT